MRIIKQDKIEDYVNNNIPFKVIIPKGVSNLEIQNKLSSLGCRWRSGDCFIYVDIDKMYGIVVADKTMSFTETKSWFNSRSRKYKELDYDLFFKK